MSLRRELKDTSDLGEFGAAAIRRTLQGRGIRPLPSVRTVGRILERQGALDGRKRRRRPAPPPGWYLPDVAAGRAELDSFDIVEGLVIKGGIDVEVLNGISLHGGLVASWPMTSATARATVQAVIGHWRQVGLPAYAQFDNDTIFQGPHQYADVVGRVMRLCLSLGVVPVFAPPRETGFQAAIENYNGRWQAKVWARFVHDSLEGLCQQSGKFVAASRLRAAARIEAAPPRRPFPKDWRLDLQARPKGRIIFLRRSDAQGGVELPAFIASRSIRCGLTAWSAPKSISMRTGSASSPCDAASRTINRSCARSPTRCPAGGFKSDRELLSLAIDSRFY